MRIGVGDDEQKGASMPKRLARIGAPRLITQTTLEDETRGERRLKRRTFRSATLRYGHEKSRHASVDSWDWHCTGQTRATG